MTKIQFLHQAILIVKLHIEAHYLGGQDANLVYNLTGLHTYYKSPRVSSG
jgi:hypothetical protein